MTITPTQADRDAAAYYRAATDYGSNDPSGDLLVIAIARYRIAAEERGARWGIEAAARAQRNLTYPTDLPVWAEQVRLSRGDYVCAWEDGSQAVEEAIRALDPKTICDSARETDDAA